MEAEAFPEHAADVPTVAPADLARRLADREPLVVLDVRAEAEYDEWRLEGPAVETLNVPYYDLLEGVDDATLEALPDDREVLVVCAKGGASGYVAGLLLDAGVDAVHLEGGMDAWADLYLADEVTAYDGPGTLVQYRRPATGCLSYLVHDGETAAVVDPLRAFADRYLADAAALGADLAYAVDTHVHADHVSGVRPLVDRGVEGVVPAPAAARGVVDPDAFTLVEDGDALDVGDVPVEARHAPGHTTGMTAYLVGGDALLTGDALFVESVARPDLEAGDEGAPAAAARLHETLQEVVLPLGDDVVVAGGHYSDAAEPAGDGTYTGTIAQVSGEMHALDLGRDAFVDLVLEDLPPRPANDEAIVETNLGRRSPDDEAAFRLELGPNHCAASRDALTGD